MILGNAYYVTVPGAGDKVIQLTVFTAHWLMPDSLLASRLINIRKTIPSLIGHIGRKAAANISIFRVVLGFRANSWPSICQERFRIKLFQLW